MREKSTYRGARRNAVLHPTQGEPGIWGPSSYYQPVKFKYQPNRAPVQLNRSRNWKGAASYIEAREIAPNPYIPVR
jgi:hypothetical protein